MEHIGEYTRMIAMYGEESTVMSRKWCSKTETIRRSDITMRRYLTVQCYFKYCNLQDVTV